MPYTRLSLLMVWLVLITLMTVVVTAAPAGIGLFSIVVAALITPWLLLRRSGGALPAR